MAHALQVYLDDPEFESLASWAEARGWTLSQAVRVAVKALTRPPGRSDPLLAASGMVQGLPTDLSAQMDAYLNLTFVAEPPFENGKKKHRRRTRKPVRR